MYADFSYYGTDFDPCTRCSGTDVVSDTSAGDTVCRSCGEIQASRVIDSSAEWRDYDDDDRSNSGAARSSCTVERFGSTSTYFAGGLSNDARDKLAKTQIEATDKRELKMMKTAEIIDDIGAKLNLTRRILNCAYDLCKRAFLEDSSQVKRIALLAAAVVSMACRMEGHARTLQEISLASGLDLHIISKIQMTLARDLHIDTGRITSESLISRIVCNPLVGLEDPVIIQYAKDICHLVSEEGVLDGQPPQAVAAAAIIFSSSICSLLRNNNNLRNDNNNKGEQLITLKNNVNVFKTVEIALATQISVKKAYIAFCLNTELVTPNELKRKFSEQQFYEQNGRVINWSKMIPTYDELCKANTVKSIKGGKLNKSTVPSSSSLICSKLEASNKQIISPTTTAVSSSSNINISTPLHPSILLEPTLSKEIIINKQIAPRNLDVKSYTEIEITDKSKNINLYNTANVLHTKNILHDSIFIKNERDTKNDLCIEPSRKLQKIA